MAKPPVCEILGTTTTTPKTPSSTSAESTPKTYSRSSKYGLTVLTSDDDELNAYLIQIMGQMERWLRARWRGYWS
ncbi:hypothetical protein TrST_g2421 [Triparma strigata]|uniref:Uncharacterized protein n=1 Tax=Triparma strigata TaxID=1606541 RepID=A0A9W7AT40_9STRA|nr:hypothetical protein TrST_g2421 [Triparma strigata]